MMKLWKDNRRDQEWELSADEIAERFWKSKIARELLEYGMQLDRALRGFIAGDLSSVWDESEYDEVFQAVFAAWPKEDAV